MAQSFGNTIHFKRILSGGQTGADRAALDFAIEHGIPHGGWCPKGRMAEDGPIHARYSLRETPTKSYPQRTEWNVRDSDGTVVFSIAAALSGGSKKTVFLAHKLGKPVIRISRDGGPDSPERELLWFIERHHITVLNVAGPRASKEPGVCEFVKEVLTNLLRALREQANKEPTGAIATAGQPTLTTRRLVLRPWEPEDATALQQLAGRREIADTMISLPPLTRSNTQQIGLPGMRRLIGTAARSISPSH